LGLFFYFRTVLPDHVPLLPLLIHGCRPADQSNPLSGKQRNPV
jgi:hypothetical protein